MNGDFGEKNCYIVCTVRVIKESFILSYRKRKFDRVICKIKRNLSVQFLNNDVLFISQFNLSECCSLSSTIEH